MLGARIQGCFISEYGRHRVPITSTRFARRKQYLSVVYIDTDEIIPRPFQPVFAHVHGHCRMFAHCPPNIELRIATFRGCTELEED